MPFDHYVSQVHLKNFNSPALEGKLYAIRKSDLKRFQTRSRDICRIEDGSTNAYLAESRAIEEFLKDVEPRYNASLAKLRETVDRGLHARGRADGNFGTLKRRRAGRRQGLDVATRL